MSFIPSIYLFILFIHLSSIHPFITWSIHPFVHLFISPSNNESFNKKCYQMNYKISVYAEKSPQMMIKTLLWQMKATESILIKKKSDFRFQYIVCFIVCFHYTISQRKSCSDTSMLRTRRWALLSMPSTLWLTACMPCRSLCVQAMQASVKPCGRLMEVNS